MANFHVRVLARPLLGICLLLSLGVGACATSDTSQYKTALAKQDQCCNGLADANAKQACLADIPRTQDEASSINQETFQCVAKHFACDPATGRASRDSAQQQLDCLNDLESTQQARNETAAAPAK